MARAIATLIVMSLSAPAAAMVGGAPAAPNFAHAVVMLASQRGFCSGAAMARDLVLTAAHCVLTGTDPKLVVFDASGKPSLKPIATIVRHPQFDAEAVRRHRTTADVALLKFGDIVSSAPVPLGPISLKVAPGDPFLVAGYGLATPGDGRSGGTVRTATLVATGRPGTLQIRLMDPATKNERAGLGACVGDSGAPVFTNFNGGLAVVGVVSWSTGPKSSGGCGGLTGVTPLMRYQAWIVEQAKRMGSALAP
ncbi:MAG: trypsin-like serine protease [Rhizobiales bacterium]|nr:trypsin-like serine protease [Hyphomicrobiales bacterium]